MKLQRKNNSERKNTAAGKSGFKPFGLILAGIAAFSMFSCSTAIGMIETGSVSDLLDSLESSEGEFSRQIFFSTCEADEAGITEEEEEATEEVSEEVTEEKTEEKTEKKTVKVTEKKTEKKTENKTEKKTEKKTEEKSEISVTLKSIDPFEYFTLSCSGYDGHGTLTYSKSAGEGPAKGLIEYKVSVDRDLENGQKVTVEADFDADELRELGLEALSKVKTYTVKGLKDVQYVDPFDGLKVTYSGIAPFCTVSLDVSKCDKAVSKYITLTVDRDQLDLHENFTVKASIDPETAKKYGIEILPGHETKVFTVENVPYYIEVFDKQLLDLLSDEESAAKMFEKVYDLIRSKMQGSAGKTHDRWSLPDFSFGKDIFDSMSRYSVSWGTSSVEIKDGDLPEELEAYLLVLKDGKESVLKNKDGFYNSLRILVKADGHVEINCGTKQYESDSPMYMCVILNDLVMYPDGRIGFGTSEPGSYEITYISSTGDFTGFEKDAVTRFREQYTVSSVDADLILKGFN